MMSFLKTLAPFGAAILSLAAAPAFAHHSFAMFDLQKKLKLDGKVVAFKWTNPHSWLEVDVRGAQGAERWAIELTSPNNLIQEGWKRTSLKPGDTITVIVNPLRDGGKGGSFVGVRQTSGATLGRFE